MRAPHLDRHLAPTILLLVLSIGVVTAGCVAPAGDGASGAPAESTAADKAVPAASHEEPEKVPPTCDGIGPQSPRDVDQSAGSNPVVFGVAPPPEEMRLCDVHFHKYAEHKSAAYSLPAGDEGEYGWACNQSPPAANGDGHHDEAEESAESGCGGIAPGDTVEVHNVFTSCLVEPAPGLGSCFSRECTNPSLRVEARVWYLGEGDGRDDIDLNELWGAIDPVEYLGSTTGHAYDNEATCSPFQVTWNVSRRCEQLDIAVLDSWCDDNPFGEKKAHGARQLVRKPEQLAAIR